MIKKILILSFISLLFTACEDENPIETDITTETTTPEISLINFSSELEVLTDINFTIKSASDNVNSVLSMNGKEVLTSDKKSFSFKINPFDYPTGENTLSIVVTDSEGNQTEESKTIELRKLLVSIAAPFTSDSHEVWFSANTLDGELLAFTKTTRQYEIVKMYANDDFIEQPIVVTSYILSPDAIYKAQLESIASIQPGTDLVKFQEAARVRTENTYDFKPNTSNELVLDILDIDSEKIANSLLGIGFTHFAEPRNTITGAQGYNTQLTFIHKPSQTITDAFIHTSNIFNVNTEEKIQIEDFKYLFLEQPVSSSISFQEFKAPTTTQSINIPDESQNYLFQHHGFKNQTAFENFDFRLLYNINKENDNNKIEFPVINEFSIYQNSIFITLNENKRLEVSTLGIKDIQIPDWNATKSGNTILMTGDYDKFTLYFWREILPDIGIIWYFTDKYQESYELPFESFVFPEEFINYASSQNLSLIDFNNNTNFYIEQFNALESNNYEETIFGEVQLSLLADVYVLKSNL